MLWPGCDKWHDLLSTRKVAADKWHDLLFAPFLSKCAVDCGFSGLFFVISPVFSIAVILIIIHL
jgi:hypothetical protein